MGGWVGGGWGGRGLQATLMLQMLLQGWSVQYSVACDETGAPWHQPDTFAAMAACAHTGSGISPIRALIESGALQVEQRSDVRLYYGTRDMAHTAYADRIPAWEAAGVRVIQVFSDADGADGSTGRYVQDAFAAEPGLDTSSSDGVGVVLCGHKEMCNAVKEIVGAAGVQPDKVLLNF